MSEKSKITWEMTHFDLKNDLQYIPVLKLTSFIDNYRVQDFSYIINSMIKAWILYIKVLRQLYLLIDNMLMHTYSLFSFPCTCKEKYLL